MGDSVRFLGRRGVEDDPEANINWIVTHGIRLTGMPAFGGTLSKDQIWRFYESVPQIFFAGLRD